MNQVTVTQTVSVHASLSITVKDYLACKKLVDFVNDAALGLEELHVEIDALNKADYELREFLQALPKQHPMALDSEAPKDSDKLTNGTSHFEQLRRKQAKELARRLLRATHPDVNPDGGNLGVTFKEVRELANAGEIEVLQFLRKQANFKSAGETDEEEARRLISVDRALQIRLQMFKATPGFRLATLYYANRPMFVENTRRILKERTEDIKAQLNEMMYPAGHPDMEPVPVQSAEERVEELMGRIDTKLDNFMSLDTSDLDPELLASAKEVVESISPVIAPLEGDGEDFKDLVRHLDEKIYDALRIDPSFLNPPTDSISSTNTPDTSND